MIANKLHLAVATTLIGALALTACKKDADDTVNTAPPVLNDPAPMGPAPLPSAAPTAINVAAVTLGTSAGADGRIASPMMTFGTRDQIIVSIQTDGAASNAQVTAKLVYQDGQTAGEQSQSINTTGMETTNVTFTNANGWPAGRYRAEVWINGTMAQSTDFTVN